LKYKIRVIVIGIMAVCLFSGCTANVRGLARMRLTAMAARDWFSNRNEIEFCHAVEWGDAGKLQLLLSNGLNINTKGYRDDMSFLMWSYLKQNKVSYQYLLEHGADPNQISESYEQIGPNFKTWIYESVLSLAAQNPEDPFYLKLALDHGGNPNAYVDKKLIIYEALNIYSLTNVSLLISSGADVNGLYPKYSSTPLLHVLFSGRYDLAYYLLEHGANPNFLDVEGLIILLNHRVYSFHDDYKEQVEYRKKVIALIEAKGVKLDGVTDR